MGKYSKRRRSIETDPQNIYIQKALQDLKHIITITIPTSIILSPDVVKREAELYLKLCFSVISQINKEEAAEVIINKIQWLVKELEKNQSRVTSLNNTKFSSTQKKQLSELVNKINKELRQVITDLSYNIDESTGADKSTFSSIDPVAFENLFQQMRNTADNNPEMPLKTIPNTSDNNSADAKIVHTNSPQYGQGIETSIKYKSLLAQICITPYTIEDIDALFRKVFFENLNDYSKKIKGTALSGFYFALRAIDNPSNKFKYQPLIKHKSLEYLGEIFGQIYLGKTIPKSTAEDYSTNAAKEIIEITQRYIQAHPKVKLKE